MHHKIKIKFKQSYNYPIMRNYNITNGKFDIDRLHNIFLNGLDWGNDDAVYFGRRAGYSTLFAFQLIGVAELDLYNFKKQDNPIWIATDKPISWIENIRAVIRYVCEREGILFIESPNKSMFRFAIKRTIFDFIRYDNPNDIDTVKGLKIYPIADNDSCFQWYDVMNEDIDNRIFDNVTKAYSANGVNFCFRNL